MRSGLLLMAVTCGCNLVTGLDEFAVVDTNLAPGVGGNGGAGGRDDSGGAGGIAPTPCMAELSDGFDGITIDAMKWEPWAQDGAGVQATGAELRVQWSGGVAMHAGVLSIAQLTFAGCTVGVEVLRVPSTPGTQAFFYVGAQSNRAGIGYLNGELRFVIDTAAVAVNQPIPYVSEHRFWRMSEKAGALHFQTSNDGTQWTTHLSQEAPPLFATPQRLNIGAGLAMPSPESGAADALFDNVRVGP